jgi:hypothetical protein
MQCKILVNKNLSSVTKNNSSDQQQKKKNSLMAFQRAFARSALVLLDLLP